MKSHGFWDPGENNPVAGRDTSENILSMFYSVHNKMLKFRLLRKISRFSSFLHTNYKSCKKV